MDLVKIGRYIAEKRKGQKLTQKQLAEMLGMSDKSVSKWERGICLPDVSVYLELCGILNISVNEFLAGEDVSSDDAVHASESNILQIAADGEKIRRRLKKTVAALVILAVAAAASVLLFIRYRTAPRNYIIAQDRNSTEVSAAELLSGDSVFIYRYEASDAFKVLNVCVSEYRSGKFIGKECLTTEYGEIGSPAEGMIIIAPDMKNLSVRLIIADEGSRLSTDIDILADAESAGGYGRAAVQADGKTDIRYGEEQGLAALILDNDRMNVVSVQELESGTVDPENDYVYYFAVEFLK